jgi:hypothetical protein
MGYYIQTPGQNFGKAQRICDDNEDAFIVPRPSSFSKIPENMGLICVVENGIFDAAAYCFSEQEFLAFTSLDDPRPKKWVIMNKENAETLSGYKKPNMAKDVK